MVTRRVHALEKVISSLLLYQLPEGEQFAYQEIQFVSLGSKKTLIKVQPNFCKHQVRFECPYV